MLTNNMDSGVAGRRGVGGEWGVGCRGGVASGGEYDTLSL